MAETVARSRPARAKATPASRCLRTAAGHGERVRAPELLAGPRPTPQSVPEEGRRGLRPLAGPRPTPQSVPLPWALISSVSRALVAASQALDSARMPGSSSDAAAVLAAASVVLATVLGAAPGAPPAPEEGRDWYPYPEADGAAAPGAAGGGGAPAPEEAVGSTVGLPWEIVKTRVVVVAPWRDAFEPSTGAGRTTGRGERLSLTTPAPALLC